MVPLVDIHCHLLAGVDDGPRTMDDALQMCALAYGEGVRLIAAGAHQNRRWAEVTPERIRNATALLETALRAQGSGMTVFPCGEIMAQPETHRHWEEGKLLSVADRGQYLLLEMPRGVFVDLIPTVKKLRRMGLRAILAHPEREAEYLHEPDLIEAMIEAGCLVQVSAASITDSKSKVERHALRRWCRRGIVHLLGSDGHSPRKRPPLLAAAYHQVSNWVGPAHADRIASSNGLAVVHGLPLRVPRPKPARAVSWWFLAMW
jgi:protein-tyrosine phosphatase